jgi:hypothetical protein
MIKRFVFNSDKNLLSIVLLNVKCLELRFFPILHTNESLASLLSYRLYYILHQHKHHNSQDGTERWCSISDSQYKWY